MMSSLRYAWMFAAVLAVSASSFALPELVVRIDGDVVTSGATVDMGAGDVDELIQLVVVLRNEGNEPLEFDSAVAVELTTDFADAFTLIQPALEAGAQLSPNGSTAFAVRLTPDRIGALTAQVSVATNDAASPFTLSLTGTGEGGELRVLVNGTELPPGGLAQFPITEENMTQTLTLRVENAGNSNLVFSGDPAVAFLSESPGVFAVTQPNLGAADTLAPGAGANFMASFTPNDIAPFTARLMIETESDLPLYEATLAGSGVGRLGTGPLCSLFDAVGEEFDAFVSDFAIESDDLDDDDLPEGFAFALLEFGACLNDDSPIWAATLSAFDRNVALLAAEPQSEDLSPYRNALAALFAISTGALDTAAAILDAEGIALANGYWSVQCDSRGTCSPIEPGAGVANLEKTLREPYAGPSDWDSDGFANRTELANVLSVGGDEADFVDAATDPRRNGTETGRFGCASGVTSAAGSSGGTVVVMVLTGVALALRRRQRSRMVTVRGSGPRRR